MWEFMELKLVTDLLPNRVSPVDEIWFSLKLSAN
jgi:hypothetical protein